MLVGFKGKNYFSLSSSKRFKGRVQSFVGLSNQSSKTPLIINGTLQNHRQLSEKLQSLETSSAISAILFDNLGMWFTNTLQPKKDDNMCTAHRVSETDSSILFSKLEVQETKDKKGAFCGSKNTTLDAVGILVPLYAPLQLCWEKPCILDWQYGRCIWLRK